MRWLPNPMKLSGEDIPNRRVLPQTSKREQVLAVERLRNQQ